MAGVRQRKGAGGAGGAGGDGGGGASGESDGGAGGGGGGGDRARGGFGFWQALSIFLLFLIFTSIGVVIFLHLQPMTIHSCRIYVPHKIQAMTHAFNSFWYYGERETFGQLYAELSTALYSDGMGYQPPIVGMGARTHGRHLLMVGGARSPTALNRARQLGLKLTIIDDNSVRPWVQGRLGKHLEFLGIANFGQVSILKPELLLQALQQYLANGGVVTDKEEEKKPPIKFDGIFTLVEDHGPLTSFLGEGLELKTSPYAAAKTARSKLAVREAMKAAGLPVPRFAPINSEDDVAAAAKVVGFPAFLKPVYGVQATFTAKVADEDELIETLRDFQARIDTDHHPIYHYGRQMLVESLMKGSELQLELILNEGEVVAFSFSSEYSGFSRPSTSMSHVISSARVSAEPAFFSFFLAPAFFSLAVANPALLRAPIHPLTRMHARTHARARAHTHTHTHTCQNDETCSRFLRRSQMPGKTLCWSWQQRQSRCTI